MAAGVLSISLVEMRTSCFCSDVINLEPLFLGTPVSGGILVIGILVI
jgi:hypothetical protein